MPKFLEYLNKAKKPLIIDGAMGTQLMQAGVNIGCFEEANIIHPSKVRAVHQAYIDAGAQIMETNTFSGNRLKLTDFGLDGKLKEINAAGIKLAKAVAGNYAYVAASMGPLGALIRPLGEISFDRAYDLFAEVAKIYEEAGADLVQIETISDLQEMRAALLAVKENTKLPVACSMTYDEKGFTVTGTPPEVAVVVLEGMGADIIGANCSSGPEPLLKTAKRILNVATVPVLIMPNAGMPELVGDSAVYKMTPEQFANYAVKFVEMGVRIIGGCCGTTPGHIRKIAEKIRNHKSEIRTRKVLNISRFASRTQVVGVSGRKPIVVGERINTTVRKQIAEDIKNDNFSGIRDEAVAQVASGAEILDINVGVPDTDEVTLMRRAVEIVQGAVMVPISIDSANPKALEAGLKECVGKPLVNSVNGKKESLAAVLPLVKKYGAAVVALTLDEGGIAETAEQKLGVAAKIIKAADKLGIPRQDIYMDTLVMTVATHPKGVKETLRAIQQVKKKFKVRTSLGISNVSFGLPVRKFINRALLSLAGKAGLDVAIVAPATLEVPVKKEALAVLSGQDAGAKRYIKKFTGDSLQIPEKKREKKEISTLEAISKAIINGDELSIVKLVERALHEGSAAQTIIDQTMLPAMDIVGERFSKNIIFLPQVIASAGAMKLAFNRIKAEIRPEERKFAGKVIVATVKGDIHDIGKSIVATMLENSGFQVIDLGKDVPAEKIVDAARKEKADIVMLSALLTTTMPQMKVVKKALDAAGLSVPVMVGGAPVTGEFAAGFKANFSKDAAEAVRVAKGLLGKG